MYWATQRDAHTGGRLVLEFDVLCRARCQQRFQNTFPLQANGLPNKSLQRMLKDCVISCVEKHGKDLVGDHCTCRPLTLPPIILIIVPVIPYNEELIFFASTRSSYWFNKDLIQVSKVCYADMEQPWRPHLDLIPGVPPPLGVLHNADAVRKLLPSFLFLDFDKVSSTSYWLLDLTRLLITL